MKLAAANKAALGAVAAVCTGAIAAACQLTKHSSQHTDRRIGAVKLDKRACCARYRVPSIA